MSQKRQLSEAEIEQRRAAKTVHGGAGAVAAITEGRPLRGLAAEAERAVYVELDNAGRPALVIRNAARLQAACDLYWHAVETAAQKQDLIALDRYVARFGWLASASLRAWAQVKQERPDGDALDYEVILAKRQAQEGRDNGAA